MSNCIPKISLEDQPLRNSAAIDRPRLTFGVKIEIVIAGIESNQEDPTPDDPRQVSNFLPLHESPWEGDPYNGEAYYLFKYFASELTEAGQPSEAEADDIAVKYDPKSWMLRQNSAIHPPHEVGMYGENVLDHPWDPSPAAAYTWHGVEIATPAHYFSDASMNDIKNGCEVLASTFRVNTNPSCGLKVHVGCGEEEFSFTTVRNLFATLLIFEPQIDQIHGRYRVNTPACYSLGLRKSMLRLLARNEKNIGKEGIKFLFHRCKGFKRLAEMVSLKGTLNGLDRMGYNMINLVGFQGASLEKTIEFRQHKASIHPETVANWISFCVRLVEFADTVDSAALEGFLTRHIYDDPEVFGIGEVCVAIGAPELARYFEEYVCAQKVRDGANAKKEKLFAENKNRTSKAIAQKRETIRIQKEQIGLDRAVTEGEQSGDAL